MLLLRVLQNAKSAQLGRFLLLSLAHASTALQELTRSKTLPAALLAMQALIHYKDLISALNVQPDISLRVQLTCACRVLLVPIRLLEQLHVSSVRSVLIQLIRNRLAA